MQKVLIEVRMDQVVKSDIVFDFGVNLAFRARKRHPWWRPASASEVLPLCSRDPRSRGKVRGEAASYDPQAGDVSLESRRQYAKKWRSSSSITPTPVLEGIDAKAGDDQTETTRNRQSCSLKNRLGA